MRQSLGLAKSGATTNSPALTKTTNTEATAMTVRRLMTPNEPSSATRPARRVDCNREAMAGFAAAHG